MTPNSTSSTRTEVPVNLDSLATMLSRLLIVLQIKDLLKEEDVAAVIHGEAGVLSPDALASQIAGSCAARRSATPSL
jgi:hypothetical protein